MPRKRTRARKNSVPRRRRPKEFRLSFTLKVRLTDAQRELINRASWHAGMDISAWVREAAVRAAEKTLGPEAEGAAASSDGKKPTT